MNEPYVLEETDNYAVVYKPPRMHCAPLKASNNDTLLNWYAKIFPYVMKVAGRQDGDGGLLHRLDFETQGLVLFAKNQHSFDFLSVQQDDGGFVKEYSAICQRVEDQSDTSFPPSPEFTGQTGVIESCFRPFGPGRKQVRPVTGDCKKEHSDTYQTEIIAYGSRYNSRYSTFTIRLKKGFRHQIRCHLAWIGYPIVNDPLYGSGQLQGDGFLALRAHGLSFVDPESGALREYHIDRLENLPNLAYK